MLKFDILCEKMGKIGHFSKKWAESGQKVATKNGQKMAKNGKKWQKMGYFDKFSCHFCVFWSFFGQIGQKPTFFTLFIFI